MTRNSISLFQILVLPIALCASVALLALPQKSEAAAAIAFVGPLVGIDDTVTVYTFTNQDLGTAASDRIIFVIMHSEDAPADDGALTIAGISATKVASIRDAGVNNTLTAIYWASVPSGTTGTIEVTFGEATGPTSISTFRATGIGTSLTASDTATDIDDVISMSIDVPEQGILIAGAAFDTGGQAITTVGVTEDYDAEEPIFTPQKAGGRVGPISQETNRTVSFDGAATDAAGAAASFAPLATGPTVATRPATLITGSSATLNATTTGSSSITARGFAWGTNSALSGGDTATTTESGSFGAGSFTKGINLLSRNTTYYFRAYATDSGGTGYGSITNFTTSIRKQLGKPPNNLGLVGYWSFNEGTSTKATDFSGNGNTGTLKGNPTWKNGKRGSAIDLDGSGDYISTTDINATDGASAMTTSFWLKADDISGDYTVVSKNAGASSNWVTFFGLSGCGNDDLSWTDVSDTGLACTTGNVHQAGRWEHWTVVFDGSQSGDTNRLKIYLNGVAQTLSFPGAIPATTGSNSQLVTFGDDPDLAGTDFPGLLEDIRIYNRALSASEVAALYAGGTSGAARANASSVTLQNGTTLGPANGLVGHWTFDGADVASVVYDRASTNHGYFIGDATSSTKTIGKLGQALNFDGTDDFVNVGSNASLQLTGAMTVCAWVKADSFSSTNEDYIVARSAASGEGPYTFFVKDDGAPLLLGLEWWSRSRSRSWHR